MQVTGTTGVSSSLTYSGEEIMGKDDFLRLLTMQLRYQDPVEPVKNEDFVAQLAQFTTLEQMQNLGENMSTFIAAQTKLASLGQAASLLGKSVEIATAGGVVSGTVSGLRISADGVPYLQVNEEIFPLSDVISVAA